VKAADVNRIWERIAGVILASAVLVNLLLVFVVIPELTKGLRPLYNQESFQDGYDLIAANLADGHGYRFYPDTAETVMREPGYPVVLAGLRRVFGPGFEEVKIANVCFALMTAWILMYLGGKLVAPGKLALLVPAFFLIHPGTVIAESRGGVEILFGALLTLFMLAVYKAIETEKWSTYLLAGYVLGFTVLVRSTPIIFAAFLLVYVWVAERRRTRLSKICRNAGVMVMAMISVLSPWIIRNYALTGRFIPTASVLGVSAQAGQYICTNLTLHRRWVDLDRAAGKERERLAEAAGYRLRGGYYQVFYSTIDEITFSNYLLSNVVERYREKPWLCLKCIAYNVVNLWCAGKTWSSTAISAGIQFPYLGFALAGVIIRIRERRFRSIGPIVLLIVYTVAVYAPILAQARYSVPLVPFVSLLASIGLVGVWRVSKRDTPISDGESASWRIQQGTATTTRGCAGA